MTTKKRAKRKTVKTSELKKRLEHDENAWLKMGGQIGDYAREVLRSHERIDNVERRVTELENKTTKEK